MAAARHELFVTAQRGVDGLNGRLEDHVSVMPVTKGVLDGHGEGDSVASDPEELFHRDVGVQTSSKFEDEGGEEEGEGGMVGDDVVQRHTVRMQELKGQIQLLSDSSKDALEEDQATASIVGDLQAYLDELIYGGRKSAFSWENKYGLEGTGSRNSNTRMDEVSKFKAEIRSLKGALLSARNFPSGGAGNVRIR